MSDSETIHHPASEAMVLELPAWFRPADAERYWGRDPKSAQEKAEPGRIRWALRTPQGPMGLEASWFEGNRARVTLATKDSQSTPDRTWVEKVLRRMLGLHLEPATFERSLAAGPHGRLVAGREGLTIPQTATVFDGAVWVICGQQVSLPVAFAMRRRLTERFGQRIDGTDFADLFAPPRPEDLANATGDELGRLGFSRRKAEYLLGLSRLITDGLDLEALRGRPSAEVEALLLGIRGFGPWSVNYLMMRALGFEDRVPVGDAGLARGLVRYFDLEARPNAEKTLRLMEPFAPYRSLATFHLWASFA